jgi:hypothetical protein
MAAMSIPVFWYMLFDEGSLALGPDKENKGSSYLHLTTPTAEGLARAEDRWPAVCRVLGRNSAALFQTWLSFVRSKAKAYLHCETAEWFWMFKTHDEFDAELRTCLAAFDHIPERTKKGIARNKWWDRLLGQAHVGTGRRGGLEPLGNLSYCGFAYHYEVPWSEESNIVCGVMSEKVRTEPAFGDQPEDLLRYLESVYGPAGVSRLLRCRCGGQVFRLLFSREGAEGALRTCTCCSTPSFVLNSKQYWEDARPVAWACKGCGGAEANIGVGFELDHTETSTEFISVGQRCVRCGRLDRCLGWEETESLSWMDSDGACDRADELFCAGDNFASDEQFAEALECLRAAWDALPEPREKQKRATEILAGIADAAFHVGQWAECRRAAQDGLRCGEPASAPSFQWRLGQALFELGEVAEATEVLTRLYADHGLSWFQKEDPKYLNLIRARVKPPPGG